MRAKIPILSKILKQCAPDDRPGRPGGGRPDRVFSIRIFAITGKGKSRK